MNIPADFRRQAFSFYLRSGRFPPAPNPDRVEFKFNPYHDPRNGQFTFAPGGPHSLSRVIISDRRSGRNAGAVSGPVRATRPLEVATTDTSIPLMIDAVYRVEKDGAGLQVANARPGSRTGRGGNISAFQDPMTLQQVFPGLARSPGGAIIALADNVLDFAGPARGITATLTRDWSNILINQIKTIDPTYRFDSLGFPQTFQGQINQLNELRSDRAAAFYLSRGETRPLQVETLRFLQRRTDAAYVEGVRLLRAGKLDVRLSPAEAVGNYVDRQVRDRLRQRYGRYGISTTKGNQVRVNGREYDTTGTDRTYRRPDARVGDVAFDVTLTRKTLATPQVRGFFASDFNPAQVVIIRPSQLGGGSSYIITRPETKR